MEPKIIRSKRKTLSMSWLDEGLVVRAPLGCGDEEIRNFLHSHRKWLEKTGETWGKTQARLGAIPGLSPEELRLLQGEARDQVGARVAFYAPLVGVSYRQVRVHPMKSRWGSCSAKGNLNFNSLLVLAPPEVLDSVVVHELCHRKFMNHSKEFYQEVYRVFPQYPSCHRWLKEHGQELLCRLPKGKA